MKRVKFIDEFTRISTDLVVIALNSVAHRPHQINKDREFKNLLINYNNNNFKLLQGDVNGYIFILKKQ